MTTMLESENHNLIFNSLLEREILLKVKIRMTAVVISISKEDRSTVKRSRIMNVTFSLLPDPTPVKLV